MRSVPLLGLILSLAACGLFGPPLWVARPPVDDEFIFGVGFAGFNSSSNPQRARELAYERAVTYLGKAIRVRVTSGSVLRDTNRWTDYQAESVQFSDEDLAGVELLEVWSDGERNGKPLRTYVLVRMPRSQATRIAARLGQ